MQSLRRVGMDTGQLTDEEVRYIDARVVETVRPMLIGRRLFPVFRLPTQDSSRFADTESRT
jgi:hypothetical protein